MPLSPSPPAPLHTKCNIDPLLISCDLIYARPVTLKQSINDASFINVFIGLTPWTYPFTALNCGTPAINRRYSYQNQSAQVWNIIPSNDLCRLLFVPKLPRIIPWAILFHAPQDISVVTQSQNTRKPTDKTWIVPSFFNSQTSFFQIISGGFPESIPGFRF